MRSRVTGHPLARKMGDSTATDKPARAAAVALTLALALGLVLPATASTTKEPSDEPPRAISPEDALHKDAQAYASAIGVAFEDALARLQTLEDFSVGIPLVETAAGNRFAGLWIEHEPDLRLVVRLTGSAPVPPQVLNLLSAFGGDTHVLVNAGHTYEELLAAQQRATSFIHEAYPDMGFGVDVQTGSIELRGPTDLSEQQVAEIEELAGVPISVTITPSLQRGHTYGGHQINAPGGACTTGFTSVDAVYGTKGVLTAGHCANGGTLATYIQTSTIDYRMSLGGKRWDANQDFSWWKDSTHGVYPLFFDGSQYRDVLGTKMRSQMQGQPVCHYGIKTGYSCGFVDNVNYNPGSSYCGDPNFVQCSSVWVAVGGSSQKCWFGDSGGPYFWQNTAWGLYSGQASNGPGSGQCFFVVMQSQEALSWDGVNTRIYIAPGGIG